MITCVIKYDIAPADADRFAEYAGMWNTAIPRCGADLVGYFGPHEGSASTAYGIYSLPSLAAYEAYRARLRDDPLGREAFAYAQEHRFIRQEERLFLKRIGEPSR